MLAYKRTVFDYQSIEGDTQTISWYYVVDFLSNRILWVKDDSFKYGDTPEEVLGAVNIYPNWRAAINNARAGRPL